MDAGPKKLSTITARADFLAAAQGRKWVASSLVLQCRSRPAGHPAAAAARLGFTVTKKMGGAVERNRIKRRLRHAAAQIAPRFVQENHDYVLISRLPALTCAFSDLLRDMEFAFSRIHANKKPSE